MATFRNILCTSSGDNGTVSWPSGVLTLPQLASYPTGAGFQMAMANTAAVGFLASVAGTGATADIFYSQAESTGFTGKHFHARENGSMIFAITAGGSIELGHASDTTLARSSAGNVTIEGNVIYRAGGTDVPVTDGGTGASTQTGALTNLGVFAVVKSADTSRTNTTTLADDDHLTMTVGTGIWDVEIVLIFNNVSTTSYGKAGPAYSGTAEYAVGSCVYHAHSGAVAVYSVPNASDTSILGTAIFTGSAQRGGHRFKFTMKSTASGTLSVNWAQGVLDAVNAAVLKKGSYMKVVKIAE